MLVITETNEKQHAFLEFHAQPIGKIEIIDGVKMRVINNTQTTIVTYEEVEEVEEE